WWWRPRLASASLYVVYGNGRRVASTSHRLYRKLHPFQPATGDDIHAFTRLQSHRAPASQLLAPRLALTLSDEQQPQLTAAGNLVPGSGLHTPRVDDQPPMRKDSHTLQRHAGLGRRRPL